MNQSRDIIGIPLTHSLVWKVHFWMEQNRFSFSLSLSPSLSYRLNRPLNLSFILSLFPLWGLSFLDTLLVFHFEFHFWRNCKLENFYSNIFFCERVGADSSLTKQNWAHQRTDKIIILQFFWHSRTFFMQFISINFYLSYLFLSCMEQQKQQRPHRTVHCLFSSSAICLWPLNNSIMRERGEGGWESEKAIRRVAANVVQFH